MSSNERNLIDPSALSEAVLHVGLKTDPKSGLYVLESALVLSFTTYHANNCYAHQFHGA